MARNPLVWVFVIVALAGHGMTFTSDNRRTALGRAITFSAVAGVGLIA